MSDFPAGEVPVGGSLSARIIRKCPTHTDCPLTCKQRQVEELGEIASFDTSVDRDRSIRRRLIEAYHQWQKGR